jgi:AAA domain
MLEAVMTDDNDRPPPDFMALAQSERNAWAAEGARRYRERQAEEQQAKERRPNHPNVEFPPRANGADKASPRFPLVRFDDVAMSAASADLVKNVLPRSGLAVVWGPPKCGKSFWLFDLLMHVALGWKYRSLRVQAGTVVYIALEGAGGFKRRVEAFRRTRPEAKGAPVYLMFAPLDLVHDHKALIASIRAQLPADVTPAVVAIDTLNRSLRGSESKDEDMGAYVRAADAIRDAFDCCVSIVHHCGHNGERPRGHSSLLGAADVQIAVKRQGDDIVAQVEHAKDGEGGLEIVSRLAVVPLGKDEDGDPMTSCVVEAVEADGEQQPQARSWPKTLTMFKRAFDFAFCESPEDIHPLPNGPAVRAVKRAFVRHEFMKSYPGPTPKAKGMAFSRAAKEAVERRLMVSRDVGPEETPYFWTSEPPAPRC